MCIRDRYTPVQDVRLTIESFQNPLACTLYFLEDNNIVINFKGWFPTVLKKDCEKVKKV